MLWLLLVSWLEQDRGAGGDDLLGSDLADDGGHAGGGARGQGHAPEADHPGHRGRGQLVGGDNQPRLAIAANIGHTMATGHDQFAARRNHAEPCSCCIAIGQNLLGSNTPIGQNLSRLQRGAVRGHNLTGSCELERLTWSQTGQLELTSTGQLDSWSSWGSQLYLMMDPRMVRLDVWDADGGPLVMLRPGGSEDDLLRCGTSFS